MRYLKADTAVSVVVGPMVAIADGFTTVDAATVTDIDCGLIKPGGGTSAITLSASAGDNDMIPATNNPGHYVMEVAAGDVDTEGPIRYTFNDVDVCLPFWEDFMVVNANVYDSLFAAATTDYLQTDTVSIAANVITATAINADAITAAKIADDALVAANFATGALTADAFAADAIVAATLATGAISADAFAADAIVAATLATGAITADAFAANAIVAATLNADCITAAKIADNAIAAEHIAAAAIDNATFAADVGSTAYATNIIALAVRKVLDEIKLDHLVAIADADDVVNDSIMGKIASTDGDWSAFSETTDSLQSIRDSQPAVISAKGIPKNVAYSDLYFPMVDSTDHVSPKTGLAGTMTVERSIDGGAMGAATGTVAEIGVLGVYQLDASQADMNGNVILFKFTGTDADAVYREVRTSS